MGGAWYDAIEYCARALVIVILFYFVLLCFLLFVFCSLPRRYSNGL